MGAIAAEVIVSEYLYDRSGLVREDLFEGIGQLIEPDATSRLDRWLSDFEGASRPTVR